MIAVPEHDFTSLGVRQGEGQASVVDIGTESNASFERSRTGFTFGREEVEPCIHGCGEEIA